MEKVYFSDSSSLGVMSLLEPKSNLLEFVTFYLNTHRSTDISGTTTLSDKNRKKNRSKENKNYSAVQDMKE